MRSESFGSVKVFWPAFSRDQLIELLRAQTDELARALPLVRVVLFGSWAKGRATAFSDIDLLVIYQDPVHSDAYQIVRKMVDVLGLEPHIYTACEAADRHDTIEAMAQSGVELWPPDKPFAPNGPTSEEIALSPTVPRTPQRRD